MQNSFGPLSKASGTSHQTKQKFSTEVLAGKEKSRKGADICSAYGRNPIADTCVRSEYLSARGKASVAKIFHGKEKSRKGADICSAYGRNPIADFDVERVTGIEPVSQPWEGYILPVNYTRSSKFATNFRFTKLFLFPLNPTDFGAPLPEVKTRLILAQNTLVLN